MARFHVGDFTTGSTVSTHSLGVAPVAMLGVGNSLTTARNTTTPGQAEMQASFAASTETSAHHLTRYAPVFASSALVSAGTATAIGYGSRLRQLGTTFVHTTQANPDPVESMAFLGGDDVGSKVGSHTISTLASTQASTGYGFQPNAAIILGVSEVSSVGNFSFGFACQTSDGTIKQWSIDQGGREGAVAQVTRNASTVSALALHTTNSTAHDVSVTSFKADGLELTVNATDTARAATVSILGLSVPKVDAGKATITTNGAGTGQTGVTVTGLGPNVGLVILASIVSSLQTLQADNDFSIGFASSNGNQRSVAGTVTQGGGASTRFGSYFNSTRAVTFISARSTDTNPPVRLTQGLFAATSDGFTVTFDNTVANGKDLYWGAFMNVVSNIGGKAQSDFNANAGPKEVGHIGGIAAADFSVNAGAAEVGHIGGRTVSDFTAALGLTPDFFPGEGKYHGHSEMDVRLSRDASEGLGRGIYEELSERYRYAQENSSSPDLYKTLDVTTDRQRLGLAEFGNAKFLRIIPPSTNTVPLRLAAGRGGQGLAIHPSSPLAFTVADRGGSDVYIFTTESTTVPEVFVRIE